MCHLYDRFYKRCASHTPFDAHHAPRLMRMKVCLGGKDMGPKYAVWKIEEDKMVPCPKYEEVVEGGLYGIKNLIYPARYYPKVTKVRTEDGKWKYRLYEGNWSCYCEYEEQHIKNRYTHEPQNYDDDK